MKPRLESAPPEVWDTVAWNQTLDPWWRWFLRGYSLAADRRDADLMYMLANVSGMRRRPTTEFWVRVIRGFE
jgi:hypothetical protein